MSARRKSDIGSGKVAPEELDDAAQPTQDDTSGVHPERRWATGPDLTAAEIAAHAADDAHAGGEAASADAASGGEASGEHAPVETGAHFRETPDVADEPVELDHPPRHGA